MLKQYCVPYCKTRLVNSLSTSTSVSENTLKRGYFFWFDECYWYSDRLVTTAWSQVTCLTSVWRRSTLYEIWCTKITLCLDMTRWYQVAVVDNLLPSALSPDKVGRRIKLKRMLRYFCYLFINDQQMHPIFYFFDLLPLHVSAHTLYAIFGEPVCSS
jgi:hypothetical protein